MADMLSNHPGRLPRLAVLDISGNNFQYAPLVEQFPLLEELKVRSGWFLLSLFCMGVTAPLNYYVYLLLTLPPDGNWCGTLALGWTFTSSGGGIFGLFWSHFVFSQSAWSFSVHGLGEGKWLGRKVRRKDQVDLNRT